MSTAYFDCYSGVAGDMVLGAFVDAGLPLGYLKSELKELKLDGYSIKSVPTGRGQIAGTNLHVEVRRQPSFNGFIDIKRLIEKSRLSKNTRETAIRIFTELARAEARVHRRSLSTVHFHEVGGLDSIVDVVGAVIGAGYFDFDSIYSSPLPVTRGFVKCAHGRLPIPAPATLEIIKGIPVESAPVKKELVTPTGAAILKTLASGFGSSPLRKIDKVGYGFGDSKIPGMPNALRLMIGEGHPLVVLEMNIDDMNPELYPYVIEKVLRSGAVDAGAIPMVMKRGRPGVLLHILCEEKDRRKIIDTVMKETTTFGVRYFPVEREMTEREVKKVKTRWGVVSVKVARYGDRTTTISPEYIDCQKIASKKGVPIKEVYRQAMLRVKK